MNEVNCTSLSRRALALLLCLCLCFTLIPANALAAEPTEAAVKHVNQGEQPDTLITPDGEIPVEEDWDEAYPYGTFAFGTHQADAGEPGSKTKDGKELPQTVLIPVYRIGGTRGWATAKITYAPAVTTDKSGLGIVYDYAASGKSDILLEVEDTNPLAEYQEIGLPQAEREMMPAPYVDLHSSIDEDNTLHLSLSNAEEAESFRWQYKGPSGGWKDMEGCTEATLKLTTDDYSELGIVGWEGLDFRCILSVQGHLLCTISKNCESFVPYAESREVPADVEAPAEPAYSPIEFDEEYDVYEFTLTFAEGETVKYLRVTALDDDAAELPELGLFTIVGCEGGECSDLCNTLTLMISDNDEAAPSEIGFEVTQLSVNRADGIAYVNVRRTGGTSYNVTLDYETVDGTAKAGVDYAAKSGSLAFAGSIDEIMVGIPLISTDDIGEKSFSLKLSNLRGGGTEEICTLKNDTVTFTLRGESPKGEAGQNLATVLAGSDGVDASTRVNVEEDALIKDSRRQLVDVRMPEKEVLTAKVVTESSSTRMHDTGKVLKFTRDDNYISNHFWDDWEIICGSDTTGIEASNVRENVADTVDYSSNWVTKVKTYDSDTGKDKTELVNGEPGGKDKNNKPTQVTMTTVTQEGTIFKKYLEFCANYKGYAEFNLKNAGQLYDSFELITYADNMGYKKRNKDSCYIQPLVKMSGGDSDYHSYGFYYAAYSDSEFLHWVISRGNNGTLWALDYNRDDYYESWNASYPALPCEMGLDSDLNLRFDFQMCKAYPDEDEAPQEIECYEKMQDSDQWTTIWVPVFRVHRRVFTNTTSIPIYLYTANDANEVNGGSWTALPDNADLYTMLTPKVTIAEGDGGATENGQFYAGTTFTVQLENLPAGYEIATNGLFLINGKGERRGTVTKSGQNTWRISMAWEGITEEDFAQSYQLSILLNRNQTIEVDLAPSIPTGGSVEDAFNAFMYMQGTNTVKPKLTYSKLSYDSSSYPIGSKVCDSNGNFQYYKYFSTAQDVNLNLNLSGSLAKATYDNIQKVNFHQDPEDVILYNGRAYCGDDDIVLCESDLLSRNAHFTYYGKDYLDRVSTMAVFIDHVELYRDGGTAAFPVINGSFDANGDFVSEEGDEYIANRLNGDYPESMFKPERDAEGAVHQYVLRVYYTMRPRAFAIPAGGSQADRAQILPGLASAITDTKAFNALTPEQQSYRYVRGSNTDEHLMYGKDATLESYVDIPLGGDLATIRYDNNSTAIRDKNGKITGMDTTEKYTWVPEYIGNLLVPFANPMPVIDNSNVTGEPVSIAGKNLTVNDGIFNYDKDSRDKMNAFLGAMVGRSTFILSVQEQKKPLSEITNLSDITPEAFAVGNVSTTPNADSVMNQSTGGDPGTTQGETPGEDTGHSEFGADLGTSLPSLELELGDYATLIMDGYQVGFAIGIPLYKYEDTNYTGSEKTEQTSTGGTHTTAKDQDGNTVETITEKGSKTTIKTIPDPNNPKQRVVETTTETFDGSGNRTGWKKTTEHQEDLGDKTGGWMCDGRKTEDTHPPAPSQNNGFKEANGGMQTLAGFISACTSKNRGALKDFFDGTFEDESYKNAKNGNCTSTKVEVSFTVQISIMFEFNPIDNCHYFKSAGLSATLGVELSAQHRFSAAPICYVYVKLGIEVEVAVSLSCIRNPKLGKEITSFRKGSLAGLSKGQELVFEINMKKQKVKLDDGSTQEQKIRGFHIDLLGMVYMEVYDNANLSGGSLCAGYLSGDGTEKEVLLKDYNKTVYVKLSPLGGQVVADKLKPVIGASSKVVFDGLSITPSISLEAGVGIGIEILKFEVFVKTSIAITMTMGGYLEETDSYEGFYISSFEWGLCLGFNIVALFFNYSMDCIGISVSGEQHGTGGYFSWDIVASAVDGNKVLWEKNTYTSADGKSLGTEEPTEPADNNIGPFDTEFGYQFGGFPAGSGSSMPVPLTITDTGFPDDCGWTLKEKVKAWEWDGGCFKGEVPQDHDLCKATSDNVYVQFTVPAGTENILVYFDGKIDARCIASGYKKDNVKKSPLKISVGSGEASVKLYLHKGTTIDRWAPYVPKKAPSQSVEQPKESSGASLIHVSGPTDVSATQKVLRAPNVDERAILPTGTDDFQLSGYNTAGDAKKLVSGLTGGYSYKLFEVGKDNYILYPLMLGGTAQLVLSKIVMTGNLQEITGLEHPTDAQAKTPWLKVDTDDFGDLDYNVSVSGSTVHVIWTAYRDGSVYDSAVLSAGNLVVKQAALDLSSDAAFSEPTVLNQDGSSAYRFLPALQSDTAVWAESVGDGSENNENLAAYLISTNPGLTQEMLANGTTDNAMLANALFRWVLSSDLNAIKGDSSRLLCSNDADATIQRETLENIELGTIDGRTVALYSTTQTAYFDSSMEEPTTLTDPDDFDEDTELASIRRLYLRQLDSGAWGDAILLQTVVDFDHCTDDNIESKTLKDGVYAGSSLVTAQADPYFGNFRFLQADLGINSDEGDEGNVGVETVALFEMGGNSYLIRQADVLSLLNGSTGSILPIFEKTTGTDVAIGSDGENLVVVYTAAVPNSVSNAIYSCWWDRNIGGWGSPTILAMRNLQVYEDGIKYDLSPEEMEKIYLGKEGCATPNGHTGTLDRLFFSDLQMSTRTVKIDETTERKQLMVLTMGSMQKLKEVEYAAAGGGTVSAVAPDGPASLNFYAIAFGAGEQALGEANLSMFNYDFSQGSRMVGGLSFVNTGTAAIRAGIDNPVLVRMLVMPPEGYVETNPALQWPQEIARWQLTESIPSGGSVGLSFRSDELQKSLPEGSVIYVTVSEDSDEFGTDAFYAEIPDLLTVEKRAELSISEFRAEIDHIKDGKAYLDFTATVSNNGNFPAAGVYLQFSYDTGTKGDDGLEMYLPVDIRGSQIETEAETEIGNRAPQHVEQNYQNGVYQLQGPESGANAEKLDQGYYRIVKGSLAVPIECFVSQEEFSGLHLKAEVYSNLDTPDSHYGVYTSDHKEYNESNNRMELTLKHQSFFDVPDHIVTALGTTLVLPVSFKSTSSSSELEINEISDGTEGWEPLMGVCYYDPDRQVIVAAPNAKAQAMLEDGQIPTGILQIKDNATNSIAAIAYKVGTMAEGVNIYRDDATYRFFAANGDEQTDLNIAPANNPPWIFLDRGVEIGWTGGDANEIPMNNDLSVANQDGAYLSFVTVADTMTLYFMGDVTVSSSIFDVKVNQPANGAESPVTYEFKNNNIGNETGMQHTVTIRASKGTRIDRYVATYKVNTVPDSDPEAPQILWNRSSPETASVLTGGSVAMTCYLLDSSGLQYVYFNGKQLSESTTPKLVKADENLWYFDYSFTDNGVYSVKALDLSGKSSSSSFGVDWFNNVISTGAISDAPGLTRSHLSFVNDAGAAVDTGQTLTAAPYLKSSYEIQTGENSNAYLFQSGAFSENALPKSTGERWLANWNGYYQVRADRSDGTWARAIVPLTTLDLTQPADTLNLEGEGSPNAPYLIGSLDDWNELRRFVNGGNSTAGMCFQQIADIAVTDENRIGLSDKHFRGSYDGGGHTLTFTATNGPSDCAPFCYVRDAAFQNLHIDGEVTSSNKFVAAIASDVTGGCTIINCRSSLVIHSNVNGDGTHGGFVAVVQKNAELTMIGCTFDGALYGPGTTRSSAFVGCNKSICRFTDCFCAAQVFEWTTESFAFSRDNTNESVDEFNNCYYSLAPNDTQGVKAWAVRPGADVDLRFARGTEYNVAGLTAFAPGLALDGTLHGGEGETVRLIPNYVGSDPDNAESVFVADAGVLNREDSDWSLLMPAQDVTVDVAAHDWGEPIYNWADDYSSVTAARYCKHNVNHSETETAQSTSNVTKPASCTEPGETTYSAVFQNEAFKSQIVTVPNIDPIGHAYGLTAWSWTGYTAATATFTCTNDPSHVENVDAMITSERTEPGCETDGQVVYTATVHFGNRDYTDQKTETLPATGHAYKLTAWNWTGYTAATATFTCTNDPGHVENVDAMITSVRTEPTAEEDGSVVYTATIVFGGKTYTDSKTEILPALGHDYALSSWTWDGYTSAIATFKDRNGGADLNVDALISQERTEPGCVKDGKIVYTAAVTLDGKTYTDTKTETLPAVGHDWDKPSYVWANDFSEITATRICKTDATHTETEKGTISSEITKEANYDEDGVITYTATFTNPAFVTQTKEAVIPKLVFVPCDGDDCPGSRFTDMPPKSHWSHDPIDWALTRKLTAGTSATTFSPKGSCTRAQFMTFLWRLAGSPEPTTNVSPFTDVPAGKYYTKAVLWANENKITGGTGSTTFSPKNTCTRAQIVTFLWRYAGSPEPTMTENPFMDVPDGKYYAKAVLWAYENKITGGTSSTTFGPKKSCTRAQAVTFLYKYIEK